MAEKERPASDCRHFSGYKPCGKIDTLVQSCSNQCVVYAPAATRVLLVHLGALGAVVRSTALLPAIHRRYPGAHITWVTEAPADVLLREHPQIDRVVLANADGVLALSALEFDVALVVDKSLKAAGVLQATKAAKVYGYVADAKNGGILPATVAAEESWELGLSNHLKFNVNRKPETRLMQEALELGTWSRDPYSLYLSRAEKTEVLRRRAMWSDAGRSAVVGLNTGCASTISYKKLSIDGHVRLLSELSLKSEMSFVLLGGKEDTARNQTIAAKARAKGIAVIESTTVLGLRDGMVSLAACDVVVTGDSLGLHMALGFQKPVVAWFGPTCAHEIDLYGGSSVLTKAACSPCWKRECDKPFMCYDQVDFRAMARAVATQLKRAASLEVPHEL